MAPPLMPTPTAAPWLPSQKQQSASLGLFCVSIYLSTFLGKGPGWVMGHTDKGGLVFAFQVQAENQIPLPQTY